MSSPTGIGFLFILATLSKHFITPSLSPLEERYFTDSGKKKNKTPKLNIIK